MRSAISYRDSHPPFHSLCCTMYASTELIVDWRMGPRALPPCHVQTGGVLGSIGDTIRILIHHSALGTYNVCTAAPNVDWRMGPRALPHRHVKRAGDSQCSSPGAATITTGCMILRTRYATTWIIAGNVALGQETQTRVGAARGCRDPFPPSRIVRLLTLPRVYSKSRQEGASYPSMYMRRERPTTAQTRAQ